MKIKLYYCPRCGNTPYLRGSINNKGKRSYSINCDCGEKLGYSRSKEAAINRWNKKIRHVLEDDSSMLHGSLKEDKKSNENNNPSLSFKWVNLASSKPVDTTARLVAAESWEPKKLETIKIIEA